MMYWSCSYLLLGTLSLIAAVCGTSIEDYPIGINLGSNFLTSAYLTDTNEYVEVASVNTTQQWREFYHHTLRKNSNKQQYAADSKTVAEQIQTALTSIHRATSTKLSHPIEILGITYPSHIQESGFLRKLLDIATESLSGMKDGTQVWPYLHSIRLAYGLNTAKALGYPEGIDINMENNLLLNLDYQGGMLEVSITSITAKSTATERFFKIDEFGGVDQVSSPENHANLRGRIRDLLDEELRHYPSDPSLPEDFRRVIFSGDAPSSEFRKLRETVVKAVPEFEDRCLNDLDPFWVGAFGAARRAKEYRATPPVIDIAEQIYERDANYESKVEHAEL